MNDVFQAAFDLQEVVRRREWPYCLIGGIVVNRWGVQRQTMDADMTVLTCIERDDECIAGLLAEFAPWFADPVEAAHRSRVLFLRHPNGVRMDVALGAMEFEARSIERASWWASKQGYRLFTCSAEDLVVHKAYAARAQDWVDVASVLDVQAERLNLPQIFEELAPLLALKEDDGPREKLEHLLRHRGLL